MTDRCYDRHGKAEFLDFLELVAKAYPRRRLHVALDDYHTHKHDDIKPVVGQAPADHASLHPGLGLLDEPRLGVLRDHHPPGHPPRLLRQRPDLVVAIRAFIDTYNTRCKPFVWTKTADDILPRGTRKPTSDAGH